MPRAHKRPTRTAARCRAACAIIIFSFALSHAPFARAETKSVTDFVDSLMTDASQCAARPDRNTSNFVVRLARYIDIDFMAQMTLGSKWVQLDTHERDRYLRAYRDLVRRIALKFCASNDLAFEKLGSRRSGETELIAFRVQRPNGSHDLYWYVRTVPELAIIDIATDGVLISERLRSEFEVIIRMHDGDLTALPAAIDRLQP